MHNLFALPTKYKRPVLLGLSICNEKLVWPGVPISELAKRAKLKGKTDNRFGGTSLNTATVLAKTFGIKPLVLATIGINDTEIFGIPAHRFADEIGIDMQLFDVRMGTSEAIVLIPPDRGDSPVISIKPEYKTSPVNDILAIVEKEQPAIVVFSGCTKTTEAHLINRVFLACPNSFLILSPRPELIEQPVLFHKLLPKTDLLVMNTTELGVCLNQSFGEDSSITKLALEPLHALGTKMIIITSKTGVTLSCASENIWICKEAIAIGKVVDRTGSGDAFLGGFIAAILNGATPDAALHWAISCAALSSLSVGGANPPTHSTFKKILGKFPTD